MHSILGKAQKSILIAIRKKEKEILDVKPGCLL